MKSIIYRIFTWLAYLICLSSHFVYAIYNIQTNKEVNAVAVSQKYWLLVDQNCLFCDEVVLELEKFCKGKKPTSKKIGFFMIGVNKKVIQSKLRSFSKAYDIYIGSPNEFYNAYNLQGSPSLLFKGSKKFVLGKDAIIKKLKKDQNFCKIS